DKHVLEQTKQTMERIQSPRSFPPRRPAGGGPSAGWESPSNGGGALGDRLQPLQLHWSAPNSECPRHVYHHHWLAVAARSEEGNGSGVAQLCADGRIDGRREQAAS